MGLAAESHPGTDRLHVPVMLSEVRALLCDRPRQLVVDATVGTGGHAEALLEAGAGGTLIGMDRDPRALEVAGTRLGRFGARVILRQADFAEVERVLGEAGFAAADAIFADLGMSSYALDDPARGFSFRFEGPLDMRMDPRGELRAYDLVNEEGEDELARIIREFGEERAARRIARAIVEARRRRPLETTTELRALIERAAGGRRHRAIHPATRTFQALRIAVNHELESLRVFLDRAPGCLAPGGRLAIIAYHSLEDRPVKHHFRALAHEGGFVALTPRALRPQASECAHNPRARSARLRAIERSAP
ncbi:MAG TPA: 16S rRNA (cytosine(1402)-N(4))-methyltransferase RsmH [Candidatus Binataceae bacterium]|jgi:16S rRNA (cytosine1402-N4)-methyltransferase|nr:16S rRNA (cytosine(1402)-N(4))-methyltransferase RsmH [Candidatus Binataceae bacterium]